MNTLKIVMLAKKHLGKGYMVDSAELCMKDVDSHIANDMPEELIVYRALKSLAYSVGTCHSDYIKAKQLSESVTA